MRLFLTSLALVAVFLLAYVLWGDRFEQLLAGERAVEHLRSYGALAPLAAIGLLIGDLLLPVPATAVLATLGILYGPVVGGLIGSVGTFLAGTAGYALCRALGRRAARFLLGERDLARSQRFFSVAGGWTVALSRWMIILPELVSCLAGLARMPARQYFLALACGTVPMSFTYATLGAAGSERPVLALTVSAAVPVLLWPVARWILLRRAGRGHQSASEPRTG